MVCTDYPAVRDLTSADLTALLKEAAELEAGQVGDFTTALHDAERRYLDIMAELFRRGELPGGGGCGPEGCGGRCGCTGCVISRHNSRMAAVITIPPAQVDIP